MQAGIHRSYSPRFCPSVQGRKEGLAGSPASIPVSPPEGSHNPTALSLPPWCVPGPDQAGEGDLPAGQPRNNYSRAKGRATMPDINYRVQTIPSEWKTERCLWKLWQFTLVLKTAYVLERGEV